MVVKEKGSRLQYPVVNTQELHRYPQQYHAVVQLQSLQMEHAYPLKLLPLLRDAKHKTPLNTLLITIHMVSHPVSAKYKL